MTYEADHSSEQQPLKRKNILARALDKVVARPERRERPRVEGAGYTYHSDELNIHASVYRETFNAALPIRVDALMLDPSQNSLDVISYPYDYPIGGGEAVRGTRFVVQEAVAGPEPGQTQIRSSKVEHIPGNTQPYIYGGSELGLPFRDQINERGYVDLGAGLTTYRFRDLPRIEATEVMPDDLNPDDFMFESPYAAETKVLDGVLGTVASHSRRKA